MISIRVNRGGSFVDYEMPAEVFSALEKIIRPDGDIDTLIALLPAELRDRITVSENRNHFGHLFDHVLHWFNPGKIGGLDFPQHTYLFETA